jgi:CRP/FNR family cyclic AMP-dependent transcriptional regulator
MSDPKLHQRRRRPNLAELQHIPWLNRLTPGERELALSALMVSEAQPGELICRMGHSPTYWFGVIEGLLKMSTDSASGNSITFTGLSRGGWFGEGTMIKREPYRYNVQALRKSLVAGLSMEMFHRLLDQSLGFNQFIMGQLNERLGQFIAAREIDRMTNPDVRVARGLASLFNPVMFPGVGEVLQITQQELSYLVGLSRQRVNMALQRLQTLGLIRIEYGGLRVLRLDELKDFT